MKDALTELELQELLLTVSSRCKSGKGARLVQGLSPGWDRESSLRLRSETLFALSLLHRQVPFPADDVDQVLQIARKVSGGALALDPSDLRCTGRALADWAELRLRLSKVGGEQDDRPPVPERQLAVAADWLGGIPDLGDLGSFLMHLTTEDGELSPDASPALKRLRKKVRKLRDRLRGRVEDISRRLGKAGYLRDTPPSLRNGRYVLPVLAGSSGHVRGIVHDRSDTGETVYMEPIEITEDGNQLQRALLDLEDERRRLLREATTRIREARESVLEGARTMAEMDAVLARASYHEDEGLCFPRTGRLSLLGLRHLLIPPDEVVPNDVDLPESCRVLLISGPNAGGKSVLLKAVGLAIAGSQSGLGAAVREDSSLPHFSGLMVSIGDQQSISEHLSTYSARLMEVTRMLRQAGSSTLVLIDEPAAGTDPVAGSALASVVLDSLADKGCMTIATTHMGALKAIAADREGFYNGSMSFDEKSLQPEYRFRLGLPGSSYTMQIARRMGFPEDLLDRAFDRSEGYLRADELLAELEGLREDLGRERALLQDERRALRDGREKASVELSRDRAELERLREYRAEETERMLRELESRADSLLQKLSRAESPDQRTRARREIRDLTRSEGPKGADVAVSGGKPEGLREGSWVSVRGWKGVGRIESMGRNRALISFGNLRLERELDQLSPAQPPEEEPVAEVQWEDAGGDPEIDLIGLHVEEALVELDRWLDECVAAGLSQVRVIHGKGTWALMRAVSDFLRDDARIDSFRQAPDRRGGAGATVADLRPAGGRKDGGG
ncbi:hypothetical protein GF402_04925 [Candidatus Fermentibacteria bacterium]|nr:hypothetical protein [Candidatus Fermentibacteria bacterium]